MNTVSASIKSIDIVAISDFHGEVEATNEYPLTSDLYNLIQKISVNNPEGTLVLGVGDLFDNPPISKYLNGIPARKVLEVLGMEASALGNHEFLWENLDVITDITIVDSKFPILCANMYHKNTGKLVFQPYKIFEKGGARVAVLSVAGPVIAQTIQNRCPEKFFVTDGVEMFNKLAADIRAEKKADVIIGLVHEGGRVIDGEQIGGIFEFAKDLKGIDALYGGHSHSTFITWLNGMHMLNGDSRGRGFIHTRITIKNDGTPPEFASEYISAGDLECDASEVILNEEIEQIIKQSKIDSDNKFSEIVGYTAKTLTKNPIILPFGESELGNWVCDVYREMTGADICIHSVKHMGIMLKGKVTTGGLFYASKRSIAHTMRMDLAELKEVMEYAFRDEDADNKIPKGEGIQVSGIKIKYDMTKPSMNRIVEITKKDGTPIETDKRFLIAINSRFMGNSNLSVYDFSKPEYELKNLKVHVYDLLADYLRKNNGIVETVLDNRIENVNGSEVTSGAGASPDEPDDM